VAPANRPHSRFLLRGSALLIVLLTVWWLLLLNPMLSMLRGSVEVFGGLLLGGSFRPHVVETPSGGWGFQVHGVGFDMPRSGVITFSFGLPVYWAIILAAPGLRRSLRPLILGTALLAMLETVLLLLLVELVARNTLRPPGGVTPWHSQFGEYMVVTVIPYAAPFLMAVSLHRELRWQIFGWGGAEPPAGPAGASPPRSKKQRRREIGPGGQRR